jgi:hypothetical protein
MHVEGKVNLSLGRVLKDHNQSKVTLSSKNAFLELQGVSNGL